MAIMTSLGGVYKTMQIKRGAHFVDREACSNTGVIIIILKKGGDSI